MTYDVPPTVPPAHSTSHPVLHPAAHPGSTASVTSPAPDPPARTGVNGGLVVFGLLLVLGAAMAVVVPATADVVAWERVMPIALVGLGVLLAAGGAFGLLRRRAR